ncbi:hypothetical protein ACNRBS_01400 [Ralstonia pseudosolanacearum]|uniref:hypothetical protein n=1 Tax=Ralstonia pseudosolanacearum TaxID=1310165 RepID=UPI003AAA8BDC
MNSIRGKDQGTQGIAIGNQNGTGARNLVRADLVAFESFRLNFDGMMQAVQPVDTEVHGVGLRAGYIEMLVPSFTHRIPREQNALVYQVTAKRLRPKSSDTWVNRQQLRDEAFGIELDVNVAASFCAVRAELSLAVR